MKKIAVYGSLKKGFYNYRESMGDPIAHSSVLGAMFLCHSYPQLYRPEDSSDDEVREHPVEIYNVNDEQYDGIVAMELGAGYMLCDMSLVDNYGDTHFATVFFYKGRSSDSHYPWIEGYNAETVPHAVRN